MASRGQSIVVTYVAWDTVNNVGKTGDVANHTLRWIKDGTASAPTNSASEVDATNAPGVYKITLTTAECTCDSGTLAGKSSSANISIMPKDVTFEQLPTAAPGATNGLPMLSATGAITANMTQINGDATNGNNAKLYLKHLSVINDTATEAAVELRGANAGSPSSRGGEGLKITGGGGGLTTSNGYGLNIQSGVGGNGYQEAVVLGNYNTVSTGLTIRGNGLPALVLYRHDASNPVVSAKNSVGNVRGTIEADITGNVSGSVGIVSTLRPVKNVGYNNFMFPMFDSSTKSPKAGLSVTAKRAIDGNPFSTCSNAVAEIGSGVYRISLSAEDMNGDKIMFRFTATGADDQLIEVFTQG